MTEYDYSPEGVARYEQKMATIFRWTSETGRFKPADPFAPTTPALQVRALQDPRDRERDRDFRRSESGSSENRKHRSRSMGERDSRPTHSRSHSYAPTPPPPVIPGPLAQMQQMHGQSTYSFDSSYQQRSKPKRSTTMPLPPPIPPVPTRSQPVRAHTNHPTQGYNVYFPPQLPRPGEPMMVPQGGVYLPPPGTRPQFIQSPLPSPGYSSPQSPRRSEGKSWLSKLGSIFSSRSPSPPSVIYIQQGYEPAPQHKRSKSSKSKGKRRHSERSGRRSRSERRYSY